MTHDIDNLAAQAYADAVRRGKTREEINNRKDFNSVMDELAEFYIAHEGFPSDHIPEYTETAEELADVIISCMTELHKRGVNVSDIIKAKVEFNSTRK